MEALEDVLVNCPYCGERIALLVDTSLMAQDYIEDCQVCCQPMRVTTAAVPGAPADASVRREDET